MDKGLNSLFKVSAVKLSPYPGGGVKNSYLPGIFPSGQGRSVLRSSTKLSENYRKSKAREKEKFSSDPHLTHAKRFDNSEIKRPRSFLSTQIFSTNPKKIELKNRMLHIFSNKQLGKFKRIPQRAFCPEADPYHSSNLHRISSFYDVLHIHSESLNEYPYISKSMLKDPSIEVLLPIKPTERVSTTNPSVPSLIPVQIPTLTRVSLHIPKVSCNSNIILVNFESVYTNHRFHPSVYKILKRLAPHFQLILVTSETIVKPSELKSILEANNLKFSGIYAVKDINKEKLLDYSLAFDDFGCFEPLRQCLIVTHHNIYDIEDVEVSEVIGYKLGVKIRLNAEKLPIVSKGFETAPIAVLLPSPTLHSGLRLFSKISKFFVEYLNAHFYLKDCFDFEEVLREAGYKLIESDLPGKAALGCTRDHDKKIKFMTNLFVI